MELLRRARNASVEILGVLIGIQTNHFPKASLYSIYNYIIFYIIVKEY
jgi:hypothetical protein